MSPKAKNFTKLRAVRRACTDRDPRYTRRERIQPPDERSLRRIDGCVQHTGVGRSAGVYRSRGGRLWSPVGFAKEQRDCFRPSVDKVLLPLFLATFPLVLLCSCSCSCVVFVRCTSSSLVPLIVDRESEVASDALHSGVSICVFGANPVPTPSSLRCSVSHPLRPRCSTRFTATYEERDRYLSYDRRHAVSIEQSSRKKRSRQGVESGLRRVVRIKR